MKNNLLEGGKVAELMKVRYKVIADFWNSSFKVGELLLFHFERYFIGEESRVIIPEKAIVKYPHLFKKLFWWEERKEEEMPEYVKRVKMDFKRSYVGIDVGGIDKVKIATTERGVTILISTDGDGETIIMYDIDCFIPATKQEFLEYLNRGK